MTEMMEIIRGLTAGGYFAYEGEVFDLQSIKICPVPSEPIPLLVGGHSEPALKRAARLGDGWMHAGGDPDEMLGLNDRIHDLRRAHGRDGEPFEIHVISLDGWSVDGCRRLEDMGVTDVIVGFRDVYTMGPDTQSFEEKRDALRRYADEVIANV